ncbi:fasciclin domain-containing protein [Colwellia sp. RSH04]|uniref:fasciclin domain-containing protein n=1 Tax=Colwellia sp. RSH04 TaxID=2305464 RepID=UPI000E5701FA|nr:fasciclin domain-containing protein [Colwellia sp. RSH04]RHW75036.1 fasciclin domain-containing protein [Colwellia sp. RSH04]
MVFLQGCNDDDDKTTPIEEPAAPTVTTIVDAAVSNGSFTTLVAALQATGLDSTLADTSQSYTVFAPTDAAFALLGQDTIDALLADTDTLSDILTYHVISGEVNAATAIGLAGTKAAMVNGDEIALSLDGDSLLVNTATVTATDIQTDNGIIHVIDAVLLPPEDMVEPMYNIVDTAVASGDFTTLVAALQATGLDAVLADESETYTVFAPTDAAFAMIGEETINTLLANTDVLSSILLQHVVAGSAVDSVTAYSLNGAMVETASMASVLLKINSMTDMLMFGGANIQVKDIYTTNGIIHVIDAVIVGDVEIPSNSMSLVDVAVNNGNFTTLAAALQATGLDTVLADLDSDYTVFAPTDAAFAKLPEGTVEGLTTEQLASVLLYHVIPGKVMSDGAITLAQSDMNMAETANGTKVSLSFVDSTLFINGAKVSTADVMADNGVIHVVDNVILPPSSVDMTSQSIVDVALADPDNFSTLVAALSAADLVSTLADETATFTVFAPTNAAFEKIDSDALSALLADSAALTNVLLSHVVSGASLSALDAYAANGKSITTASGNQVEITVDETTGMLMIGGANVTVTNIQTSNGTIHVIDTVILD